WLGSAATLGVAAFAGAATAQSRPSADELIRTVKGARMFDLSFTWNEQSPVLSLNPPYSFALNRTHKMTHEILGQAPGSRVSWASDIMYFSGQHGAPTIDAIGHIGRDLKLYGGVDAVAATSTPGGIGAGLGIDSFPVDLMISRAVFLDVARQVAGGRPDPLPPGFEITAKHLDDTLGAQAVDVRKGDSLLIRTGWGPLFGTDNAKYLGEQSPGPGPDAAKWIIAHGVRLAGGPAGLRVEDVVRRPALHRHRPGPDGGRGASRLGRELSPVHPQLLRRAHPGHVPHRARAPGAAGHRAGRRLGRGPAAPS